MSRAHRPSASLFIGVALVLILSAGCDQAPGVEPPGGDPPVLSQFNFSPHTVTLGDPGVEEVGESVRFSVSMEVTAQDPDDDVERVSYVIQSPLPGRLPVAEGELTSAGGSQFSRTVDVTVPQGEIGTYTVLVYAVDETGSLSDNVRGILSFGGEGEPPVILEVTAPDTIRRPATGEDPTVLRVTATVSDPDGLSSIAEVVFWNVDRPSVQIDMADDGELYGDQAPGDGVYTRTVQIESGNEPGPTVLAFQATDRSGLTSNVVEKTIIVE